MTTMRWILEAKGTVRGAKQTAVKVFRSWVEANRDRLQSLTFNKLTSALHDAGVNYHYFCAMD